LIVTQFLTLIAAGTGVERVFNIARNLHEYHRAQLSPESITKAMLTKHYNRHKWVIPGEWENVEYRYGTIDSGDKDMNEKDLVRHLEMSDDDDNQNEDEEVVITSRKRVRDNNSDDELNLEDRQTQSRRSR
jgi:hypothetical protein